MPRGIKGGEKPAQVRGLFERFDQTRKKSAEGVVKNLGREECVNLVSTGGDKPSVCKDTQNLHSVNNKMEAEKKIVTAKATRKKLLSEEDNETVYGNTGDVVARRPHSRSNGSSLLATQLSVSETVEERLRTSTRARKSSSRSTGALMEGDLLGSIIRGGMQNDGKKTPHEMKLSGNTEAKKGKAITEDTPSLVSSGVLEVFFLLILLQDATKALSAGPRIPDVSVGQCRASQIWPSYCRLMQHDSLLCLNHRV